MQHAPATLPCSDNSKALMSFFELYSANVPLLMPSAEWMYRLLYMRGQLSVGERCLALASKILGHAVMALGFRSSKLHLHCMLACTDLHILISSPKVGINPSCQGTSHPSASLKRRMPTPRLAPQP